MQEIIIKIPKVDKDERIGSVFNHLFYVIFNTENAESNVVWDFSDSTYFHPFFIAPLSIYKKNCGHKIVCRGVSDSLSTYLKLICFNDMLHVDKNLELDTFLWKYKDKTYIPICSFGLNNSENIDTMQNIIQGIIERQSHADKRIKTPLSYFLSELICNISQHSLANTGYIFSQYSEKERCINLCIADNGITIFGSYVRAGKYIDEIGNDEAMALKMANEGFSTKDLPNTENRGFGISTTKDMLVNGLKGAFFMLSGSAFHRYDKNGKPFVRLPDYINWKGTIILMKIPVDIARDFDYSKYI